MGEDVLYLAVCSWKTSKPCHGRKLGLVIGDVVVVVVSGAVTSLAQAEVHCKFYILKSSNGESQRGFS